jgi:glycerophosphoryl diester phosphodiesterase
MDAFNPMATTPEEYLKGTAEWRTDLYTSRGRLLSHAESIELFKQLGAKMTPELKSPSVTMPFEGDYTQEDYARQLIDEYKAAGVDPENVWVQSFNLPDVLFWVNNEPEFGEQAVYLDDEVYANPPNVFGLAEMEALKAQGVNIIAPPLWALLTTDAYGEIVPSDYANDAKTAGLDIITWTFERSDLRNGAIDDNGNATWYYQTIGEAIQTDSDMYEALDVLAKDVGILGMFSDWPATVTYYANCMNLR